MNLDSYQQSLTDYLDTITLTATQDSRISSALENVAALMLAEFPDVEVYAQGSYSTDTLVKPLTSSQGGGKAGEYDIDIVAESPTWEGAVDTLDEIADVIESDGTYSGMPIDRTKNSCIRIDYAADASGVGFHVDLVPTKNTGGVRSVPDRKNNGWKHSDAKRFADWFNSQAEQSPGIRQMALIIKRLRDLSDLTDDIKSILVLTLVVNSYYANGTIMGDLLSVLDGVISQFPAGDSAPFIANPVNDGENLGAKLEEYSKVRSFFVNTRTELARAVADDDAAALKAIFGSSFSYTAVREASNHAIPAVAIPPTRAYGALDGTAFDRG